jgi:hypothetical protein
MTRQPGMMAEQIAHREAVGRDGVMQPEFRDVFPHRLLPIHAPLVHQERQPRGGERLRGRADQELCVGCHRQAGFDIAKAIGPDERHLPVLHHRNGEARNLPFVHRFRDETFDLGNEGRNGFAERDRLGCHRKGSSTGARKSQVLTHLRPDPKMTRQRKFSIRPAKLWRDLWRNRLEFGLSVGRSGRI